MNAVRCYNQSVLRGARNQVQSYALTKILAPGFRSRRSNLRKPGVGSSRLQARIAGASEDGVPAQENQAALTTNQTFLSKVAKFSNDRQNVRAPDSIIHSYTGRSWFEIEHSRNPYTITGCSDARLISQIH